MVETLSVPTGVLFQPTINGFVTVRERHAIFVQPQQLDVLSLFLPGSTIEAVAAAGSAAGLSAARLNRLIADFTKYGLIQLSTDASTAGRVRVVHDILPSGTDRTLSLDGPLRVGRSVVLSPGPRAFVVEAAQPLVASPEIVRLLPQFVDGRSPRRVVDDAAIEDRDTTVATIGRLVAAGVLVPSRPIEAREEVNPRRRQQSASTCGDGRIPVYPIMLDDSATPPLALGMIVALAGQYGGGRLHEQYRFVADWFASKEEMHDTIARHGSGVLLLSMYLWSEATNLMLSAQVKRLHPRSVTVIGGPSAPKYEQACADFLDQHPHVDIVVRGEGELTAIELLDKLQWTQQGSVADLDALADVRGLTYRRRPGSREYVRTPDRERIADLSTVPSAYLSGVFDSLVGRVGGVTIETNRGCPYGCTFCDWGSATQQKIKMFPLERVRDELEWIARNRIEFVGCADANFGILERDVEIAAMVADMRNRYGYPRQWSVNYAKNATRRHAEILRILRSAGVQAEAVLSIQSTDPQVLRDIRRTNIKTERYDELAQIFRSEGMDFSSDLMIGLPGQTVETFKNGLQHFFERDVFVQAYRTEMLPNSPMADPEYVRQYQLKARGRRVIGCYSFDEPDLERMQDIFGCYSLLVNLSVLKYVLRYLQLDHGHRAVDVVQRVYEVLRTQGDRYPRLSWLVTRHLGALREMLTIVAFREVAAPGSWEQVFDEVRALIVEEFGVRQTDALDSIIAAQVAVLPTESCQYPYTVALQHDVVSYMNQQWRHPGTASNAPRRRLEDYEPGQLVVTDSDGLSHGERDRLPDHSLRLELDCELWPVKRTDAEHPRDHGVYARQRSKVAMAMRRLHSLTPLEPRRLPVHTLQAHELAH